tara:strand:+ start:12 stop:755 length:744 start_codon:yes stop_codon:yes gene_type:complete
MNNLEFFNRNQASNFIDNNKPLAIIPTGSVEQHLNHLFIGMDINTASHIAEDLANEFSKKVLFYRPLNAGIAEHHMAFPGTITLRVNTFIGVLTDIAESLVRGGVKKILFINGHGGNVDPMATAMRNINLQMKGIHENTDFSNVQTHYDYEELLNKDTEIDIRFTSYWEMHDLKFLRSIVKDEASPGHAGEYESSIALHLFPDFVDQDAIKNNALDTEQDASKEKGEILYKDVIEQYSKLIQGMLNS